jgi:predicted secreted protein
MKQTAVEWLVEQICGDHTEQWQKEIEQAKEMEKEQIKSAFTKGDLFAEDYFYPEKPNVDCSENYYNETFNKSINNKG